MKLTQETIYKISKIIFVFSLIYPVFSAFFNTIDPFLFFNNDALFLPSLFNGVFKDGFSFSSWKFPDAPFLFPDFISYIFLEKIFGNFQISNILLSLIFYDGIFISLYFLFKKIGSENTILLLTLSLLNFLISSGQLFLHTVFFLTPTFHQGEILFLVILLIFTLVEVFENKSRLVLIFLLTLLTVLSDRSLVKDFVAPLGMVTMCYAFFDKTIFKKLLRVFSITIAATLLGSILYKNLVPFPSTEPKILAETLQNVTYLANDFYILLTKATVTIDLGHKELIFLNYLGPFLLVSIGASLLVVGTVIRTKTKNNPSFFISLFIVFQFIVNLAATIIFGYYRGLLHLRYFSTFLIFPVVWLFYYLGTTRYSKYIMQAMVTGTFLMAVFFAIKLDFSETALAYVPDNIDCVSNIAREQGLKYGVAEAWEANSNSLFSNDVLRIHPVTENNGYLAPFHWQSSYEWFLAENYDFILDKNITQSSIENTVGKPDETLSCPSTNVLVYKNSRLRDSLGKMFAARYFFHNLSSKGDFFEITGSDFNNYIFDKSSTINQGPVVTLGGGRYKVEVTYICSQVGGCQLEFLSTPLKNYQKIPVLNTNGAVSQTQIQFEINSQNSSNAYGVGALQFFSKNTENIKLVIEKID